MDKKIKASFYKSDQQLKLYIGRRLVKAFDTSSYNLTEENYCSWFRYKLPGDDTKTKFDIIFEQDSGYKLYIYPVYGTKVISKDPIDVTVKK